MIIEGKVFIILNLPWKTKEEKKVLFFPYLHITLTKSAKKNMILAKNIYL